MNKKLKKLICIILALTLFAAFPMPPASADSSGLVFIAVNDRILDISKMPYYLNGITYIRCDIFKEFGISYTYFAPSNAALLSSGSTQLVFYLDDNTCYDGNGQSYPLSATSVNGVVYVPVYTGKVFNLSSNTITGTGYGDLLRIKNGTQTLTDSAFIDAAKSLIYKNYQDYTGTTTTAPPTDPPPPEQSPDAKGSPVYLCFIGMPTEGMMNTLKSYGVSAAFFITAEQARENPDMARRIVGEGSTLGIYCESAPETECEEAATAIAESAFFRPTMVSSGAFNAQLQHYATENGMVYYEPQNLISADSRSAAAITGKLPKTLRASDFLLHSGDNAAAILPAVLQHLAVNGYFAMPLRETSI